MTIEPEPAPTAGLAHDHSIRGQSLSYFPARAVGSLNGLTRLPRPVAARRQAARQWNPGVTILLPRLSQLMDSPCSHRGSAHQLHRSALTLPELSLVLSSAGGACSEPGSADCLELEVFVFQVQGVAPACYRYLPLRHALVAPIELELRQRHGGQPSAPEASMTLAITARPASRSEPPVSPFTPEARLAASLVTGAAMSAATRLGLSSACCPGQHQTSYRVTFRPPSAPP